MNIIFAVSEASAKISLSGTKKRTQERNDFMNCTEFQILNFQDETS